MGGALKRLLYFFHFLRQEVTDRFDFNVLYLADPVDGSGTPGAQSDKSHSDYVNFGSGIAGHIEALAALPFALLKCLIQFSLAKASHSCSDQTHAGQLQEVTSVIVH